MKKIFILFLLFIANSFSQLSIEHKLDLVHSDITVGGRLILDVNVKVNNPTGANTLASFTIDITFDTTKLKYIKDTLMSPEILNFYNGFTFSAGNTLRFGGAGLTINSSRYYDLSESYVRWVRLIFAIKDNTDSTMISLNNNNIISLFSTAQNTPYVSIVSPPLIRNDLTSIPLLIELSSFNAVTINNNVVLNWSTKTEMNIYGFEVQRKSLDGIWDKISFLKGYGNSTSTKNYTYLDKFPKGGKYLEYRLKQIDDDGKITYSKVVEVQYIPINYFLYQNYPNPFNPATTVRYSLPKESKVKIVLYNELGQMVREISNLTQSAGNYDISITSSGLSSGVYIYVLEAKSIIDNNSFRAVKKMILLK